MSLLDKLVNVSISMRESSANAESFSSILLVGKKPKSVASLTETKVSAYSSAAEIAEEGWATSEEVYKAAAIAFKNGASLLYVAQIADEKTALDALKDALEVGGWYAFAVVDDSEESIEEYAKWAEANKKLFGFTLYADEETDTPLKSTYVYAFGFVTKLPSDDNIYTHIAVLAKGLTYASGSETWAYKTLAGITVENFTSAEQEEIKKLNLNYYVNCAGKGITLLGVTTSGEYIDVVRFRDWLINDIQTRVYNLFIQNAKVPFTTAGISLIQNQLIASLKAGQAIGGIAQTEYDENGEEIAGYTTSVPELGNISDANRQARVLPGIKFTARLAGAIHLVEIKGTLSV